MSLAQRSLQSATWAAFATIAALPINFIHSVLLARWLPIEYFGVFAAANSIILLSWTVFEFGFGNAFIHRSQETEDESRAVGAYFTLRLIFDTAWAVCLTAAAWYLFSDLRRIVLIALVLIHFVSRQTITPRTILIRRVKHRRLAVIDLTAAFFSALVALTIAYFYRSIWALLISPLITTLVSLVGMYLYRPFWKPALLWDRKIWGYFFRFGSKNLFNNVLETALDNLDNLWTSFYLGDVLLGFYSRAYKFAIYPRMILAAPISSVALGTFAELKHDRKGLSHAFFQANAFLIRAGFFLAGWIAILAPYLIELILGNRWLPMLTAFRLMLLFTMLDLIKGTLANVLIALGLPEQIGRVRFIQLAVLLAGLFILGLRYKTAGVALAMDLMALVGTVLLVVYVRPLVDISWRKLISAPLAALIIGLGFDWLITRGIAADLSVWLQAGAKAAMFPLIYFGVLVAVEGQAILRSSLQILEHIKLKERLSTIFSALQKPDGS